MAPNTGKRGRRPLFLTPPLSLTPPLFLIPLFLIPSLSDLLPLTSFLICTEGLSQKHQL